MCVYIKFADFINQQSLALDYGIMSIDQNTKFILACVYEKRLKSFAVYEWEHKVQMFVLSNQSNSQTMGSPSYSPIAFVLNAKNPFSVIILSKLCVQ